MLLSFSPLENKASQNAVKHVNFLEVLLQLLRKEKTNIAALFVDNFNGNGALARDFGPEICWTPWSLVKPSVQRVSREAL